MDNSQSTDVFSDLTLTNQTCTVTGSATNAMDMDTYEALINKTKASLCNDISEFFNTSLSEKFTLMLEDCHYCISQVIKLLVEISKSHSSPQKLLLYIEDAVSILHLLTNFIKRIVENVAMSCSTMKTFPITTGQIIMDIFIHCRNSETVYSVHLTSIQQQLKDLFRNCHELQLIYLMVLEKHFIFDLNEKEELDILVEALNINLRVGEVVQTLDVKTMAEQWKAYTMICDKYSSYLLDSNIYYDSTKLLCSMVLNNMNTSLEAEQDEKLIVRSMRVANFTTKILMRICNIFKDSSTKQYKCIVDMLIDVYSYNPAYLETVGEKTEQFIDTMSTNVLSPLSLLVNYLLNDESFVNVIINYDTDKLTNNKEILGYIYLIVTVMNSVLEKHDQIAIPRSKLLSRLFEILPDCYVWINIGLKFDINNRRDHSCESVGLFDYLLILATGLSLLMNSEEYCALETNLCEALLGVDTIRALFASNLWTVLSRIINNKQLLFNQLLFLCQTYQRLEKYTIFSNSPQRVHLEKTMTSLFELMDVEDRVKIYKQFNPLINQNNISLWSVLKIRNLPIDFQRTIEWDVVEKFKKEFRNTALVCQNEKFIILIKSMLLAATCSCKALEGSEEVLLEGWMKACPKRLGFLSETLDMAMVYFFEYVEALVSLTMSMIHSVSGRSFYVIKILHVISGLIMLRNTEFKILLMDLLCKLAATPIYDENKIEATKIINETFKNMIQDSDEFVRKSFFRVIRTYDNKYLDMTISSIVSGDQSLLDDWQCFIKNENRLSDYTKLEEQLTSISSYKYQHKCIELKKTAKSIVGDQIQNSCSSNFDLADIDSLFDNQSDGEPASKKVKFDTNEVDTILNRLERDAILLCDMKDNIFTDEHKRRIRVLQDKLASVIT